MSSIHKNEIMQNRLLIQKYPFLLPRNAWTDMLPDDYDYTYTMLDQMPSGWRDAFGEQMCAEIWAELCKLDKADRDSYRVYEIKEKYGELRWYGSFCTVELDRIIDKYVELSLRTCIICGKPATVIATGWVSPYCDECAMKLRGEKFVTVDEYMKDVYKSDYKENVQVH